MPPSVPTAFCVWPEWKENPVAPARADSTISNEGSSTQGRGMQNVIFSIWLTAVPVKHRSMRK